MIRSSTDDTDYLPARMINEVVYCPRLFYYEHVEGIFVDNRETVEGSLRHDRVDAKEDALPSPEELAEAGRAVRSRSVTLSSDEHGVIAKMDLIEAHDGHVTPVDYKRGRPCVNDDGSIVAWDADRVQLGVQALVLRDNGYTCDEAVVYYAMTKQRVRIVVDADLVRQTLAAIAEARRIRAGQIIPPPLVDSPKCPRCSLVGVCLPDETRRCVTRDGEILVQRTLFDVDLRRTASAQDLVTRDVEVRRLVPARDDKKPLYLNTQGLSVGKSGEVLKVKDKSRVVQEVRIHDICQLNLMGNIQLSTQAIQTLCEAEVPIAYFSMGGWFYGVTQGLGVKNIFLRREQFRLADVPAFCLRLARALVAGKIRNQRTLLQRNHIEPPRRALALMKCLLEDAEVAQSLEQLLGIEGNAARIYFENFAGMLKVGSADEPRDDDPSAAMEADSRSGGNAAAKGGAMQIADGVPSSADTAALMLPNVDMSLRVVRSADNGFSFDFQNRNRRPPRDPVNALLSLAYSLLSKDLAVITQAVGFDPFQGFYHQPRFGRASLSLDLMEPFRPLIADSVVLSAINTRMVTLDDFQRAGNAVALKPEGRKKFFRAYEQRMDTLVTHPLFGYRVNYRRLLEIQTRLFARVLTGELVDYPVFTTR
jgi:CRISPR-associated protein Cas1